MFPSNQCLGRPATALSFFRRVRNLFTNWITFQMNKQSIPNTAAYKILHSLAVNIIFQVMTQTPNNIEVYTIIQDSMLLKTQTIGFLFESTRSLCLSEFRLYYEWPRWKKNIWDVCIVRLNNEDTTRTKCTLVSSVKGHLFGRYRRNNKHTGRHMAYLRYFVHQVIENIFSKKNSKRKIIVQASLVIVS